MKKQLKSVLFLCLLGVMMSCSDENDSQNIHKSDLEALKEVEFSQLEEKEISSRKTGHIVADPTTGTNKYEYITVLEKPYTLEPLSILTQTNNDVIYPGSILRGDSFMKGKYDPLVLANEFNLVSLSLTLKGDINVSEDVKPILSQVRQTLNILIARQKNKVDYDFIPAVYTYESNEVSTEESFKKTFKIHADANVLGGIVKANFDYEDTKNTNFATKQVMVAFRQSIYNASIDSKHYSKWINGDIDVKDAGVYEPLYISSVDYGRIGYVLVETEKSAEETKKMIKASLEGHFGVGDFNVNSSYQKEFKKLFAQNKVKVVVNGGPIELGGQVNSYDSFIKFIQMPNAENLTKTSVPIAYKVRRLKDNTEVEVKDTYTESIIELKSN